VFGSLRSKLIASYALVIVLSLVLAGTGFTYLVRRYQTQRDLYQLGDLSLPLTLELRRFERAGATPADISQILKDRASQLDVRLMLVNQQRQIIYDTGNSLVGQYLPPAEGRGLRYGFIIEWGALQPRDEQVLTFVVSSSRDREGVRPPPDNLVLAVPEQSVSTAWLQLAPGLTGAAILAMIISVAVAWLLARSIAGPLAQVTKASEQMAKGDFEQYIPVSGNDEVGQLAASFNTMAREVGQMNRTMRDFLANVSHDLRTPLTSIEGFAQAMLDGTIKTPDEYTDAARIIRDEAERMHRLVEDLLYLSKIESGQIAVERKSLDVSDLLQACIRQVEPQASHAGLSVQLDAPPLPTVMADSHRLQQVFVNLLDNAVKHTPAGGMIQVRAHSEADRVKLAETSRTKGKTAPVWVAVEVHNSGSHIPPEHVNRIFERFYRVDRSRSDDGSGLGLAIVREIVQAHNGRVTVKSDVATGTTFTVYLPAAA
jgi:signal transduction histidine kinase